MTDIYEVIYDLQSNIHDLLQQMGDGRTEGEPPDELNPASLRIWNGLQQLKADLASEEFQDCLP